MFGFIKRKCTAETLGTIVKKRWNGNLWFITVEYFVEGQSYIVKEQLTYHVEKKIKLERFQSECILHRHLRVLTLMPASVLSTIRINLSRAICRITMDFIWDRDGV